MFKNFLSSICCSEEKLEIDLHLELFRLNDESLLNEAQNDFDINCLSSEDKNELIYLNEIYLYHFKLFIETNKGSIQTQNDFLYIIPERAPLPNFFNRINRNYHIPLNNKQTSNSTGFAQYSLKNISINEPYIIYYMRRVDSTLEIKSFFASKAFKITYKYNNAFLTKIKNLELRLVYEDDPDFFKQNLEPSTKIISAWNTPHRGIDSIKSCYSTSLIKNENSEPNIYLNEFSTIRKNTPNNSHQTLNIEEKDAKSHQRNFSIFTASKSTCSSTGDSYLGGLLENKLTKNKNLLKKNLFDNPNLICHHKNSLSMTTPKNKKIIKEYPSTVTEKKENFTKDYLLKDSFHSNQLFSYKAIKNLKNGNKSSNTCDESQLRMLTKPPIVPNTKTAKFNAKTMEFKSYFKTHMDSTKIKKESPDQSFFLNVNELSFTEINPKKKIEEKNEKCFTLQQNNSANKNSAKFLYLKIDKKNEESKGYQTPQSKNRLYTVEEVFSISNDSSSINETNCFKFSNTNSAKKANNSLICRNSRCEKNRNVANVVEEDEEISLNHITANEVSSQDERFFSEKTINLEEREDTLPNFLKTKESKEHFVNIWEGFQKNFRDIGFYGKLDFSSNIMIIYHIKSRQIYQLYKFVEFKKMQDIKVFLEDIFASVKFALL